MNRALADSGFWKGLLVRGDQYRTIAQEYQLLLQSLGIRLIMPWPCALEVFNSALMKSYKDKSLLSNTVSELFQDVELLDDTNYRTLALTSLTATHGMLPPPLCAASLTDRIVWLMLEDGKLGISHFLHCNPRDFSGSTNSNARVEYVDISSRRTH